MKTPTKVVQEVTASGYKTTVYAGKKAVAVRESRMRSPGFAEGTTPGDFMEDFDGDLEELGEAIDDFASRGFDVANALHKAKARS